MKNFIYDLIYGAVLKVLKAEELIPEVTWDKPVKEKKNSCCSARFK